MRTYVKPGRFSGRRRKIGFTSSITINYVCTVNEYCNLPDLFEISPDLKKEDLKKKKFAVFENMEEFTKLFDSVPTREIPELYTDSLAWGIKLVELYHDENDEKYYMEYKNNGKTKKEDGIEGDNILMFYTLDPTGTGKSRKSRKSQSRKRKTQKH